MAAGISEKVSRYEPYSNCLFGHYGNELLGSVKASNFRAHYKFGCLIMFVTWAWCMNGDDLSTKMADHMHGN